MNPHEMVATRRQGVKIYQSFSVLDKSKFSVVSFYDSYFRVSVCLQHK